MFDSLISWVGVYSSAATSLVCSELGVTSWETSDAASTYAVKSSDSVDFNSSVASAFN